MILLRHGQSEFNLLFTATRRDPGIVDPQLTELGHAQVTQAVRGLAGEGITRIITSPYTRTLQTAAPIARAGAHPHQAGQFSRHRFNPLSNRSLHLSR